MPANITTVGNGDDGDAHDRFWNQLKAHYLDNPDDDVLSAIVENKQCINQYLLKQRGKVSVAICKQSNALSRFSVSESNHNPKNNNQPTTDQQQLHQKLSRNQRVQHHIFQVAADIAAKAIKLIMKDEENPVEIRQAINNDDPINVDEVIIEELAELVEPSDEEEMDLKSEVKSKSKSCHLISVSKIIHVHEPEKFKSK